MLIITQMLKMLGCGNCKVNYHYYLAAEGKKVFNVTVVGSRIIPLEKCDYDLDH